MSGVIKERIFGLDLLRCVAILFVLLSHTAFLLPVSESAKNFYLMYFGFTGVEFFFILSGYLVGTILLKLFAQRPLNAGTLRYFWVRRWFRTLPAYYLTLLVYALFDFFLSLHNGLAQPVFLSDPFYLLYLVFLQNFVTAVPEFFRHSWSLSIEEWFYLLTPLWVLLFYKNIKRIPALAAILTGILLITLLRLVAVITYDPDWDLQIRMIVPLRLDSLMTGVLMAYFHLHYKKWWHKYAAVAFVIGLIILALASVHFYLYVIVKPAGQGIFSKTFLFNVFSVAIALCLPWLTALRRTSIRAAGAIITHISIISYSLYLLHLIAVQVYLALSHKMQLPDKWGLKFSGSWLACILAASLMYRFFEKPFTDMRERFAPGQGTQGSPEA